jgi:hypothetical protein
VGAASAVVRNEHPQKETSQMVAWSSRHEFEYWNSVRQAWILRLGSIKASTISTGFELNGPEFKFSFASQCRDGRD